MKAARAKACRQTISRKKINLLLFAAFTSRSLARFASPQKILVEKKDLFLLHGHQMRMVMKGERRPFKENEVKAKTKDAIEPSTEVIIE